MAASHDYQQTENTTAALRVDCQHCGQALHIVTALPSQPPAAPDQPHSPLVAGFHQVLNIFTTDTTVKHGPDAAFSSQLQTLAQMARRRWQVLIIFVVGAAILCFALFWPDAPLQLREAATPPAQAAAPSSAPLNDTTRAAIIDTLTQYNRAETEAAALLSFAPLQPLLAPGSAVAERRAAQLAQRQQENAPHRTLLVRWAVGEITILGDTATVTTQETWSNQEADAVAPDQATVRVTYTLWWDEAAARWLIVESVQTAL